MGTSRNPLNTGFNTRLWLNGGRAEMPENAMRRCVGAAPELTNSVMSRWGSQRLYPINAISVYKWLGDRYEYNGKTLFKNGVAILGGFTGGRLTFVTAPPQPGLEDYLFVLGGGKLFKISPTGTITNWGIAAPGNSTIAATAPTDTIIIDNMTTDGTGNWNNVVNTNLAFDSAGDDTFLAGGCYELSGSVQFQFHIDQQFASTQDWSVYGDGTISLQSDLVSIYAKFNDPTNIKWMWIDVDVFDGSFKREYYKGVIQLVPTTANVNAANADAIIVPDVGRWVQIALAKSQFNRIGTQLQYDWSNVQAVRLEFGAAINNPGKVFLNGFKIYGGFPLGIGPAALSGGSEYQYAVTFGNSTTGSDSNPNGMQVQKDGTVNPPSPAVVGGVALQPVNLTNIPVSADGQVDNRKLWRTSAGGALFSYLDTIPDNTTQTYKDVTGDLPGQPIIVTPWTAAFAVKTGYKVDGGNGYWFKVTTPGTTGATIPAWNLPTGPFLGDWVPWIEYAIGDWINLAGIGYVSNTENRNSLPSTHPADWTVIGTTNDNGVIWTWGGLNAVRTLALSNNLLYDNQQPIVAYGDVAGLWEGSFFWDQDSTAGRKGWIYVSPPGRPESVGISIVATSDNDPTQKVAIWDGLPWWISTQRAGVLTGSYPALKPEYLKGGLGTSWPFTVVVAQNGIYYRAPDGMRMIDRAGSILVGFQNIGIIFRGRTSENVPPFYAIWGSIGRNEIIWGDNMNTFALGGTSPSNLIDIPNYVWRMLGQPLLCAYYEKDDDELLSSFNGNVVLFENPGSLDDGH